MGSKISVTVTKNWADLVYGDARKKPQKSVRASGCSVVAPRETVENENNSNAPRPAHADRSTVYALPNGALHTFLLRVTQRSFMSPTQQSLRAPRLYVLLPETVPTRGTDALYALKSNENQ